MKTSNKILLGIFLATLLLTTTINLIVYAKYKRGDYVPFVREEKKMTTVDLTAAKYVSITALCNVEIINSPTAGYEVQQGKEKNIAYHMVGDTIVIHGNTSLTNEQMERGQCNYERLKLHLPVATEVYTKHATVRINGKDDSTQAPSFNIHLDKSSSLIMGNNEKGNQYFNKLLLSVDNSYLEMDDYVVVNDLSLKMVNASKFDSKKAAIKSLVLDVDNSSTMNLSGFSIKNLK